MQLEELDVLAGDGPEDLDDESVEVTVDDESVALPNMFGYSTRLRSMSEGRATFAMQFHAYDTLETA